MDIDALTKAASRLGETAFDPTLWPDLLQEIAEGAGAFGAMVLQAGVPTNDVPWSPSLGRMREIYYVERWNARDLRAVRSVAAVRRGLTVLTDEDLVSRDEVDRDPYYTSFLSGQRLTAFAAIAFQSPSSSLCGLVLQRKSSQGVFNENEKWALSPLAPMLTATATLAGMLGEASLRSSLKILDRLSRPALALGRGGVVVDANAAAVALFDDDFRVRRGVLVLRDDKAATEIRKVCGQAWSTPDPIARMPEPIVVRREGRSPLVLRSTHLDGPAGSFFLGARLLLTIADPGAAPSPSSSLLRSAFGMTGSEARLATHLAAGLSLQEAADLSHITSETARSQLKSVFAKTGTRRQASLVALIGRL